MSDHDQRFKTLLREFFGDFLRLFFAPWAERLDCDKVEWLDKEVFPEPPEGARHVLDLVARLPTRQVVPGQRAGEPASWLALVHVEIESPDKVAPLRPRMFRYYVHLRDRYGLPVLPVGLYLRVGLQGTGIDAYEEHFWELRPVRFEYLYVGLPALDAVEYVQGDNWLGVALAALMRVPRDRAAWLGAEALRRLQAAPLTDQQRFLLGECVQAYLPLDPQQQAEFERLIATEPYRGVQAMNMTVYEKGLQMGREEGREEARRAILQDLLEERFGPLPDPVKERLRQLAADRLVALTKAVLRAQSLRELGLEE
ncbi:MAG TPA: DUF4351 domain-containing protein [Gemmataceae bacterium]|nr:DUF4351 domain-containing protein [Gemmataceae bacterium]